MTKCLVEKNKAFLLFYARLGTARYYYSFLKTPCASRIKNINR